MKIWVITLFPDFVHSFLETSLIGKARQAGTVQASVVNLRDFAEPPHFHVDDAPYGGGAGMVMKPEPLSKAIESIRETHPAAVTILMSPRGETFSQHRAAELATRGELIFVCPRYEGVDERFVELFVDFEVSIGDYVLMGGDVAAMAVIESSVRLLPGVLGNDLSLVSESFCEREEEGLLLEAPHYTRPADFRGLRVPEVLLSGNHAEVAKYRLAQAEKSTRERRPDLLPQKGDPV